MILIYKMLLWRSDTRIQNINWLPVAFFLEWDCSNPMLILLLEVQSNLVSCSRSRNPRADVAMPYKAGFEEDYFIRNQESTITCITANIGMVVSSKYNTQHWKQFQKYWKLIEKSPKITLKLAPNQKHMF